MSDIKTMFARISKDMSHKKCCEAPLKDHTYKPVGEINNNIKYWSLPYQIISIKQLKTSS